MSPAVAEHAVLSFIPHLKAAAPTHAQTGTNKTSDEAHPMTLNEDPLLASHPVRTESVTDPYGPRSWTSQMVKLSGKNRALNEFAVMRSDEPVEENLVMLHGYGAGLGFFYKNFEGLSRVCGLKLYALDMLGMGRSTRPPFKVKCKTKEGGITEAESWFIDALEEWRVKKGIEKFTLLGHSMGGYMAVAYALRYPGHLNKLILASPVGIPEDPYATAASMPGQGGLEQSTMENEMLQDQEAIVNPESNFSNSSQLPGSSGGDRNNFLNQQTKSERPAHVPGPPIGGAPKRPIPSWLRYLWDANISPFSIVRWTGPLGPRFVSGWTSRRFSHLPEGEREALHEYAYALFRQRGSGEYALAYILAPGAFARSPLIRRVVGLGRQPLPFESTTDGARGLGGPSGEGGVKKETGYPVVLMYGEHDWMDIAGGFAAEQKLKEAREEALATASEEERRREGGEARVVVIGRAGHHLYLDGWEEFNEKIRGEMEETLAKIRKDKAGAEKEREANGKL